MTELEICNWALMKIGEHPEESLSVSLPPIPLTEGKGVRYGLPKNCLKVLKAEKGILRGDSLIDEGGSSSPNMIEYIEIVSLEDCDPLYQEAIACKLASELCPTLKADIPLSLRLKAEVEDIMEKAKKMDAIEVVEPRECKWGA